MEEKTIEVVVKEMNVGNEDFPSKDSLEGKKMVQTVQVEADAWIKEEDEA